METSVNIITVNLEYRLLYFRPLLYCFNSLCVYTRKAIKTLGHILKHYNIQLCF